MTLLAAQLTFAYHRRRPVITDLSLEFTPGITVILGPNGSGKSTLLRLLLGLLAPHDGAVTLDAVDVRRLTPRARADRLAYVPQRSFPSAAFTVRDVIAMSRFRRTPDPHAIDDIIRDFDLELIAATPVTQLSVGQQQEVTFARALAQLLRRNVTGPRYLLADEPFSALDPAHVARCIHRLRDALHHDPDIAPIMVLHDFILARRLADRIILLNADGRVAAAGNPETILQPDLLQDVFRTPFTRVAHLEGDYLVPTLAATHPPTL